VTRPLLSVCIPAYARAALLPALLESVAAQDFEDYECLVAEDVSPEREAIREVVAAFAARHPGKFRFHANAVNLGYDGNLRNLVALAAGRYVFFMGNDDLVAPGALRAVADGIARHGEVGAILRAYTFFRDDPARPEQVNRYFPEERLIPAGREAILTCYRRLVAISGVTVHRDAAHAAASTEFDGTLFYQLWLAGNVLATRPALYLPAILAHFRRGGVPLFGHAEAERQHFKPGEKTFAEEVAVNRGFFAVADGVERATRLPGLGAEIRAEFARHSYHTLSQFARDGRASLWQAYRGFAPLGLGRSPWYHFWFLALFVAGVGPLEWVIQTIRRRLGYTPSLT
jgi:abequosyltransferase